MLHRAPPFIEHPLVARRAGRPFALLVALAVTVGLADESSAQGGRFPAKRISMGEPIRDSEVVDFDEDGTLDFVAVADGLRFRRGNGDGSFGPLESVFETEVDYGLALGDIDLDGDLDVTAVRASNGSGPENLVVVTQEGHHTFDGIQYIALVEHPRDTAIADVNGDGWPDILYTCLEAASTTSTLRIRYAVGLGDFGHTTDIPALHMPFDAWELELGDFNGDGLLDVACVCIQSQVVAIRLGDGEGFGEVSTLSTGADPLGLEIADLDGDGAQDLIVGRVDIDGRFEIFYGVGNGSFEDSIELDAGFVYPSQVGVGDVDRDGNLDLAVAVGYRLALLLGDGRRGFSAPIQLSIGGGTHGDISVADVNRDGWPDLLADNQSAGDMTLLLARGEGDFVVADLYAGPSTFNPGLAVADFDGDGDLDAFATNEWTDVGTTWLGDGQGGFTAGPSMGVPDMAWSAEVGRLDADTLPDVLLVDRNSDTATVLIGQGDGSFATGQVLATGDVPRESALGDIDGDGDLDAVIAHQLPRTVQVWLGGGDGSFVAGALIGPFEGQSLSSVALGDVTGDGHLDLVAGCKIGGAWRLLPGDGVGGFPPTNFLYTDSGSIGDFLLTDLTGDGRADLLQSDFLDNSVRLYVGKGHPGAPFPYFELPNYLPFPAGSGGPDKLAVADIDLDGLPDIVSGIGNSQRVVIHFGDGAGFYDGLEIYAVDESGAMIAAGDWDLDGAPDLLAAASHLSVLHNATLDAWTNLGLGTPGFAGIPWLHGEGEPLPGQPVSLQLSHARPSAPVVLVVGLSTLYVPFKGGTLVPQPDVLIGGLATDGAGALELSATWPSIPGQPAFYFQAWVVDPAAWAGLSGSGALRLNDG